MSARELSRVEVLGRVKAGQLSLVSAATILDVSYRQVKRRYRRDGAKGLRHASSGPVATRFGPTLAAEHLAAEDGLTVGHETLRRWMLADGLWSRTRKRRPHRQRRERKAHFGELVQLDGIFHAWYEARAPRGCLVTLVDDATSQTLGRRGAHETLWAAAAVVRRWIEAYGVPHALYTDWKNV